MIDILLETRQTHPSGIGILQHIDLRKAFPDNLLPIQNKKRKGPLRWRDPTIVLSFALRT
jgi:hypothetical protein